jgi:hypothetical protein
MLVSMVKTARQNVVNIVQVDNQIAILSVDVVDQVANQDGLTNFVTKVNLIVYLNEKSHKRFI